MKVSLIALVAGCVFASSAFAVMETPPTNPPHPMAMETSLTHAPLGV